ncbi:putative ubiquitin-conjugating enzyme E2 C [Iris pallida]|uniref:Ubiquitin-conjugating enzyme E2 C n=1 Tax=Iris pallida TaxID=29817 RepID=A0AAX6F7T7_IRIPA|nr:putative ubiquitin-conjugating enzyme E2 C [Iris pallida]
MEVRNASGPPPSPAPPSSKQPRPPPNPVDSTSVSKRLQKELMSLMVSFSTQGLFRWMLRKVGIGMGLIENIPRDPSNLINFVLTRWSFSTSGPCDCTLVKKASILIVFVQERLMVYLGFWRRTRYFWCIRVYFCRVRYVSKTMQHIHGIDFWSVHAYNNSSFCFRLFFKISFGFFVIKVVEWESWNLSDGVWYFLLCAKFIT